MTDADRTAAEQRFRDDFGCGTEDARLAARVHVPFDDDTDPVAGLQQAISERSAHFARFTADLRGNELGVAARRAIEEYLQLARDHRDQHYAQLFEDILDQTRGPVAPPEPAE